MFILAVSILHASSSFVKNRLETEIICAKYAKRITDKQQKSFFLDKGTTHPRTNSGRERLIHHTFSFTQPLKPILKSQTARGCENMQKNSADIDEQADCKQ